MHGAWYIASCSHSGRTDRLIRPPSPPTAFAQYLQAWDNVLSAFGGKWNVFALDLKNEPHGTASWEAQSPATDWNRAAETIAGHVAAKHPDFRGLFFVEGIDHPTNTGTGSNRAPLDKHSKPWGGDFEGVRARAIDLGEPGLNDRVVYSPHVYGPSVFDRDYFDTKDFPANLPAIWSAQWAFVEQATSRAVVLGEWGGAFLAYRVCDWDVTRQRQQIKSTLLPPRHPP